MACFEAENGAIALEIVWRNEDAGTDPAGPHHARDGWLRVPGTRARERALEIIPAIILTSKDLTPTNISRLNGNVERSASEGIVYVFRPDWRSLPGRRRNRGRISQESNVTKVLLVEDNELNRDMLSRRLQRRGYEVVLAVDGQQAFTTAETSKPDVILMDMDLPVLNGWDATRALRKIRDTEYSRHRINGSCASRRSRTRNGSRL